MAHRPILGGCFAVIMVICDKAKGFKFSKRPLQKKIQTIFSILHRSCQFEKFKQFCKEETFVCIMKVVWLQMSCLFHRNEHLL